METLSLDTKSISKFLILNEEKRNKAKLKIKEFVDSHKEELDTYLKKAKKVIELCSQIEADLTEPLMDDKLKELMEQQNNLIDEISGKEKERKKLNLLKEFYQIEPSGNLEQALIALEKQVICF